MLKCLSSVIIVFLILFTAGCQTNTVSNMFIPSNPSGMTLAQSVKDSLMESNDPVINQIHVESNQNVVILSGYVEKNSPERYRRTNCQTSSRGSVSREPYYCSPIND